MGALKRAGHRVVAIVLVTAWSMSAIGQERVIQDIRISLDGDQALISIEFSCEMRFVADTEISGGALLEVRVAPFDTCREQGIASSVSGESYRPIGAEAAHLVSVEYDSLGLGDSIVLLTFDRPVRYSVTQRPTLREVEIVVDLSDSPSSETAALPVRRPISVRLVEPAARQDFVINLQSTRDPVSPDITDSMLLAPDDLLYVSQIRVDGVLWHRLRVGFFSSEADARAALERLAATFPRAWIGRAEPTEITLARETEDQLTSRRVVTLTSEQLEASPQEIIAPVQELNADQIVAMMAQARALLLDGDNAAAIETYRRLIQAPGEHREEAIEFLGLAYERSGEPARARNEYERYLREFPDSPNRARVDQRISSVVAQLEVPRDSLRAARTSADRRWEFSSGISQYYRRDVNQFDENQSSETTQSALLTDIDFSSTRSGEHIDLLARVSLNHYNDMLDVTDGGRGDQSRASYAFVDIAETGQRWDVRVGRQSLHTLGVLGRFDGAHFSYDLGGSRRFHFTSGFPVESTRDSVETSRQFTGVAVEFNDVAEAWDFSAFLNSQTIDSVDARMAVGTEARYFDERKSMTAMVDYDIDFGELNMVLVLGTWRLPNRMTLSALLDQRKSPILTTRNSLIGQPVETIDELLLVWTEEEVRSLAVDRTADSQTVTLGISKPLGERLQVNFDVTTSEIDGTVSSGGVSAVPGSGAQLFYALSLVGTGLFASSDVSIWNFRIGDADTYQTKLLTWDGRFPIGRRIRINPRIRYAIWESLTDGRSRTTISPSLRFLMNSRNRYRLEFEIGRDNMNRVDLSGERDSYANFVNFGYRASFQ
jgi:tetratricopeptide (TPR) repeat protein